MSVMCTAKEDHIGAGLPYLRPMRSTYGCEPPLLASTPSFLLSSYMPIATPFDIAFISVYTDAARRPRRARNTVNK